MQSSKRQPNDLAAPVTEERLHFDLAVDGRLPAGLDGVYVRTGPNPHPARASDGAHRLTGDGMVHGVRLAGGRALWYRNRWINSPELARLRDLPVPPSIDTMVPDGTGNASAVVHAGRLFTFSDMALPFELSASLETVGTTDFGGPMPAGAVALPVGDPAARELHLLASHPDQPFLRHHVVDAAGRLIDTRTLPVDRPAFVRTFAITRSELLVFDLPCLFSEEAMFDGAPLPYRWRADASAELLVLPRRGDAGILERYALPAFWISEVAAVRCTPETVLLEAICRESLFAADTLGEDDGPPGLFRITIDRRLGRVITEVVDSSEQAHPCADPRVPVDERDSYWTLAMDEGVGNAVLHHRAGRDECRRHRPPKGWRLSAPTFVPTHARAPRDDGWLLCLAHREGDSALMVFDAATPRAEPVAQVRIPARVPLGTRGAWLQDG